jgi:hypothetical protein
VLSIGFIIFNGESLVIKWVPFILIFSATLIIELFSGAQEVLIVQKYGESCENSIYISRWVPFSNYALYCGDDGEWVGND